MTTDGRTDIADRVVERIAAHALTEMPEVGGAARRVLGVAFGRDEAAPPRAEAHVDGRLATVTVTMSVSYPSPVREVAQHARDTVTARITDLTGLDVRQVDVDVASLVWATHTGRRVE